MSASLFAPAKLTLSLRVTGVRSDGMHLIDAEMVTLDFGDTIEIEPGDQIRYHGVYTGDAGSNDLVAGALSLLNERRAVAVTKRIPAGAGLGGGSADAAAVLRAGGFSDVEAAAKLGADVAFCLIGGRAQVSGIGEKIRPLEHRPQHYTLCTPPLHSSTPAVYRAWDDLGGPCGDNGNDLEPAAIAVEPRLAHWRDLLSDHSGRQARLAGSGSTWFVEGAFPGPNYVVAATRPAESVNADNAGAEP